MDQTSSPTNEKTESELIEEMKVSIKTTVLSVSQKVNKSAMAHFTKKGWIDKENAPQVNQFFSQKIPKVLSDEISKQLNEILGLNLSL